MAAISGTLSLLLLQWKGPTHGPGWAAIVQDGRSSFNFNKNISYGYINSGMTSDQIENSNFEIEVEKKKYRATVLKKPLNSKNIFTV